MLKGQLKGHAQKGHAKGLAIHKWRANRFYVESLHNKLRLFKQLYII